MLESIKETMAAEILAIRHDAIHNGRATEFYDIAVLKEWSPVPDPRGADAWAQCWKTSGALGVIARNRQNHPVGYGILNTQQSRIGAVYVRSSYADNGVDDQIIKHLERLAIIRGLTSLAIDTSLNDVNFYLRNWYMVIGIDFFKLPSGQKMACAKMNKMVNAANAGK